MCLARLDETVDVAASADPAIRAAVETKAAYVESFGVSDLVPGQKQSLIYSYRVADHNGAVLGVLCLCFRLENEADLIFSNLVEEEDWSIVTILDEAGSVIASSDPFHIPVGAKLKPVRDVDYRIVRFGPMEYLAVTRAAQPYQGYAGPGWHGHVMVPLPHAFAASSAEMLDRRRARDDRTHHPLVRTVQRRHASHSGQGRAYSARIEPLGMERQSQAERYGARRRISGRAEPALPLSRKRCSMKSAIPAPRPRTSFKARSPT